MKIVSWPTGVNTIVTSETNGSIGDNGIESDKSENGSEMSRLKASGVPDQFSVTMYFSNSTSDTFYKSHTDVYGKHITEWEAWESWFKYILMNGTNAFYFTDIKSPQSTKPAVYKITSSGLPKWSARGEYMQISMAWAEQFNDYISIQEEETVADYMDITPGTIDLRLTEMPEEAPELSDFYDEHGSSLVRLSVDGGATFSALPINRVEWDGYKAVFLRYDAAMTQEELTDTYYVIEVPFNGVTVSGEFAGGIN